MTMDQLFGKATPWGHKVSGCDDLSSLFADGRDQICVPGELRAEWQAKRLSASVAGTSRAVDFEDMGGGLFVARLVAHAGSADALANLLAEGRPTVTVPGAVRREWLLGHRLAVVDGRKRVLEFEEAGDDLWLARPFVPKTPAA